MNNTWYPTDPVAAALTAEGVKKMCDDGLVQASRLAEGLRALATVPDAELVWENTFGAFDAVTFALQEASSTAELMGLCHPDAEVRVAALTCEPRVDAFASALLMDDAIAGVLKRAAVKLGGLPNPRGRFVEKTLESYRRNGLDLPAEKRERLKVLNEKLTALGQDFQKNLAESVATIEVDSSSLQGLPPAYVANHMPQNDGKVRLTTDTPDFVPFMRYSKDRKTAREFHYLYNNRAKDENLPILDQLIALRHEKAVLLGYATWADYVLEPRMAKDAATVSDFIERLHRGLAPRREMEFRELQAEAKEQGLTDVDGNVSVADAVFLHNAVQQKKFKLDSQALSGYFEVHAVHAGIMRIASDLYGIEFVPEADVAWHQEVQAYSVRGADGEVLGRVYFDLFPRDGKYKHAAVFTLRHTFASESGRVLPVAALVCNFPKPGVSPSLLDHDQVITFFHEFGHLLHDVLSMSELASFSCTAVARDFVEAPSQLFEEWAWNREALDMFARHHATGAKIPEDLYQPLVASRTFGEAIFTDRQLYLSKLDQVYHTRQPGFDTTVVMNELHDEYSPFERVPDTHHQAAVGHLVGYDAAYYGYQWALSLAFDLFTRFKEQGVFNKDVAASYRQTILEPGGGEDENDMVRRFLGRESSEKAYLEYLGIG